MSDAEWKSWWAWTGRTELNRLLWERWDPIGFPTDDGRRYKPPEDEYDSYVDGVGRLLRQGADAAAIQVHLEGVESDWIGIRPAVDRSEVAAAIVGWYELARPERQG